MALPHPRLPRPSVRTLPRLSVPALPRPSLPPLWREGRMAVEWAALRRSDVYGGAGLPPGHGRGVLLVPGFLAGDASMGVMAQWLRGAGWQPHRAGIRANVACSGAACARLEKRLEALAETTGARVTIIGQSRGGVFAKALGARRPDLVSGVVTLGAPVVSQLAIHPLVLAQVGVVAALGSGSFPGMMTWRCLRGHCCEPFRAALAGPFPPQVAYVALYSRTDGVVSWRSCLDPDADDRVEVRASHVGMSVNAEAYREIAAALGRFGAPPASG